MDFDPDTGNPGIWTVPLTPGQNSTVSDLVQVSSSGTISLLNSSSGTADVSVTVLGYVQSTIGDATGDTYAPLPYGGVLDTRSGFGAPAAAQIPAGGSITVQVAGNAGVPGDADGAALYLGAANAAQAGFISAFATGTTDPNLRVLSYSPGETVRNLWVGAVSSSGQLTLVNHGSVPVDLMAAVQGYLVNPSSTEVGDSWVGVYPARIADTRDGTGGVPATPIPAGGSITFTATGANGVPASGVGAVVESVAASNPAASGLLSVYPAGGTDPGNAGVNFQAGDGQDNGLTAPVVSSVSPSGRETIANHSAGTVDVIVTIRGYYAVATAPQGPESVSVSVSGSSAVVDWSAPYSDGGAPISSYTVTASADGSPVTVDGNTTEATLTGLANAPADVFRVTATNAVGPGPSTTYSAPNVITGQVVAPNAGATPVAGDIVTIFPNDSSVSSTPSVLGTATTDAQGYWSFAVPPYSQLPADAQAEADANNGYLDVDAVGMGTAAAGGSTYQMGAIAVRSAWVGSATQTAPEGDASYLAQPAAVMRPSQVDLSSQVTPEMESATWVDQNSPVASDSSDDPLGNPDYAVPPAPTDQYGYQEVGGDGTYNPNLAMDGTDLKNAPVTAGDTSNSNNCCYPYGCAYLSNLDVNKVRDSWTVIGQFDNNWDDGTSFSYAAGATSNIGSEVGIDGKNFSFNGYDKYSTGSGFSQGLSTNDFYNSHQVAIYMEYDRTKWYAWKADKAGGVTNTLCFWYQQWDRHGVVRSPAGHFIIIWHKIWKDPSKTGTRWRTDNCTAFHNMENSGHDSYRFNEAYPYSFSLMRNSGITYGFAADLGGIAVKAETDHSTSTENDVYYDQPSGIPKDFRTDPWTGAPNSTEHYFWGSNRNVHPSGGSQPTAVYNC